MYYLKKEVLAWILCSKRHKSYDIIFDAVGKSSKRACAKLLNKGGVFKTVGGIEYATETKD